MELSTVWSVSTGESIETSDVLLHGRGHQRQQQQHIAGDAAMVPTTRSLPPHHDSSCKSSKPPSYYDPGYYTAAQLDAAHGADLKQQPSRFTRRLAMADDDNAVGHRRRRSQQDEEAAGTSSRAGGRGDDEDAGGDKDWLQLGLGAMASSSSTTSSSFGGETDGAMALAPTAALDLFASNKQSAGMMSRPPLFPLPIRSYHGQYGHDRYRPTTAASGYMIPAPPFLPFARPLRSCSADLLMRVVSPPPPRTEAAGLWLTLQAAPNQVREPILPQIPKSYLRIRDCNMKVEVVLKYLADKLGLAQFHWVHLEIDLYFVVGADMQRPPPSSVPADEARERQHLVRLTGVNGGRRCSRRAATSALAGSYRY